MKFKESQIGWFGIIILTGVITMTYLSYLYQWGTNPISKIPCIIISAISFITFLLFFQMRTTVDENLIQITYGIGIIKKKIQMENIQQVEAVRNKWYYGLGIRWSWKGWLYNIQGLSAVELKFKNSTSNIRIGTADNVKLKEEIEKRIRNDRSNDI